MRPYILAVLAVLLLIGCSQAGNPVSPENPGGKTAIDSIPILGAELRNDIFNATGMLGAYDLKINPTEMTVDLVSKRFGTVGESYIVGGTAFFTMTPCSTCLKVKSVALTADGLIKLTFYIRHPFLPGDPLKPPSGRNRLDLDIFDLAMLVHPVGATPATYPLTGTDSYTGVLVNNAGYTTELAQVINDPAAIPYALVIDDSVSGSSTFNKFAMGSEALFDALFSPPGADLNFELFLTMGYGSSAKKAFRLVPKYYNPEFNRKAAWKVDVIPPQGANPPQFGNTWRDNDPSTTFNVTVKVYDWQIGATVNPDLTDTTDIYAASDVASVSVEIPGMNSTLPVVTTAASGTGTPSDPLVYAVPVANQNGLPAGEYTGLVKVMDTRTPGTSTVGGETDTLAHSVNGVQTDWYGMNEFAAYQIFTATVIVGCGPITGQITQPSQDPVTGVASGSNISFTVSASSANGGDPVVLYEWDMDYDGDPAHFNVDATGPGVILGPFINPNCPTPVPVRNYTVAVRATDSCTPPNVMVFDTVQIVVDLCIPPSVGNIILAVNRLSAQRWQIDASAPFTLSWTIVSGIPEYAIYVDRDPDDGLTNSLALAGTSTSNTWNELGTVLPTNHYIKGWTYIVRARSIAGDPLSEGLDSEPAYVTFNGWETLTTNQSPGMGNSGEGWLVNHETAIASFMSFPYMQGSTWPAQGSWCLMFSPFSGDWYLANNPTIAPGRWQGITKLTPDVPNSSVRNLEFAGYLFQSEWVNGVILGSIPTQPCQSFTNTHDFKWAQVDSTTPYYAYNTDSTEASGLYGDVPSGQNNAWSFAGDRTQTSYLLRRADVNLNGHPDYDYVGIQQAKFVTLGTGQPYLFVDEVAIVIY